MTDLALDPSTGDLLLTNGTVSLVEGVDAIAQELTIRLRFLAGEWFLDRRLGIPYRQEIIGQKVRKSFITQVLKDAALATPGVTKLNSLSVNFDGPTRVMSIDISVSTTEDEDVVLALSVGGA
jgi:hypothetical protein